ncbi:hypothetical protein F8M41_016643 [Gigaspora margarita]|uniref:Uncharacterized protein n=1 Tax=Gigaspora margarita TaxID=4874 RepID=A0A8H4EML9_GIGMA|nr:hypothetical protein F8M41_016643 [Gigaspora margarita]
MLSEKLSKIEWLQSLIKILELSQKDLPKKESKIKFLKTKIFELDSELFLKINELKQVKDNLAKKNSEIRSLEARLSSEQDKIGENSQVDIDIQESLTQQTLTSLNDNTLKESEISNEKQINNRQVQSSISPKISPELLSYIISEIKNNNIPIREIKVLPIVTLGASEALVNYKYQIPPIVKLVILAITMILIIWYICKHIWNKEKNSIKSEKPTPFSSLVQKKKSSYSAH